MYIRPNFLFKNKTKIQGMMGIWSRAGMIKENRAKRAIEILTVSIGMKHSRRHSDIKKSNIFIM